MARRKGGPDIMTMALLGGAAYLLFSKKAEAASPGLREDIEDSFPVLMKSPEDYKRAVTMATQRRIVAPANTSFGVLSARRASPEELAGKSTEILLAVTAPGILGLGIPIPELVWRPSGHVVSLDPKPGYKISVIKPSGAVRW